MALTQEMLRSKGCQSPGCDHAHPADTGELWFHPKCHRNVGLHVRYDKATGELELSCRRCKAFVARVLVAPGGGNASN